VCNLRFIVVVFLVYFVGQKMIQKLCVWCVTSYSVFGSDRYHERAKISPCADVLAHLFLLVVRLWFLSATCKPRSKNLNSVVVTEMVAILLIVIYLNMKHG
jgi:hypothetical protein